jgi:hypothetical protein
METTLSILASDKPTLSPAEMVEVLGGPYPAMCLDRSGRVLAANQMMAWLWGAESANELLRRNAYPLYLAALAQNRITLRDPQAHSSSGDGLIRSLRETTVTFLSFLNGVARVSGSERQLHAIWIASNESSGIQVYRKLFVHDVVVTGHEDIALQVYVPSRRSRTKTLLLAVYHDKYSIISKREYIAISQYIYIPFYNIFREIDVKPSLETIVKEFDLESYLEGIGYEGPPVQEVEETARRLQQKSGVVFRRLPTTIYPGMPYTTSEDMVEAGATGYSSTHISRLTRSGDIPAERIDGKVILPPRAAERIIEHEEKSLAGELGPRGAKPTPRGERKPRRRRRRPPQGT